MKEDLPWFKHNKDSRHASGCKALIAAYGFEGYGRYNALLEIIASQPGARLDLSLKKNRSGYAGELRMTPQEFDAFLNFLSDEDECGLISYENGIARTEVTDNAYSTVEAKREKKRESYQFGRPTDDRNANSDDRNANSDDRNDTEQSRAEQNREEKSSSSVRAEDISPEDPGLQAYALEIAKNAKARNPGAYARTLIDKPDVRAAYLESLTPKATEVERSPPPKVCQACGAPLVVISGEAICKACGSAWVWDNDWQTWERSKETYQQIDFSELKRA